MSCKYKYKGVEYNRQELINYLLTKEYSLLTNIINTPENSSKVVDSNGQPIIVFHGSPVDDIIEFNTNAIFFAEDIEVARSYQGGDGGRIYSSFLNLKKPLEEKGAHNNWNDIRPEIDYYKRYRIVDEGDILLDDIRYEMDAQMFAQDLAYENAVEEDDNVDIDEVTPYKYEQYYNNENISTDDLFEVATEELGYDSVILEGITDAADLDSFFATNVYIASEPNQIKSATENIGTFDVNNNDIRYQKGANENKTPTEISSYVINNLKSLNIVDEHYNLNNKQIEEELQKRGYSNNITRQIIGEQTASRMPEADILLTNKSTAEKMRAAGVNALKIKKATGWEYSEKDGKWKLEIPDGDLKDVEVELNKEYKLEEIFTGTTDNAKIIILDEKEFENGTFARYNTKTERIEINGRFIRTSPTSTQTSSSGKGYLYRGIRTTILYGIQYHNQAIEGFYEGGDIQSVVGEGERVSESELFKIKDEANNKTDVEQNLEDVLDNQLLFEYYPDIKNIKVVFYTEGNEKFKERNIKGVYAPQDGENGVVYISTSQTKKGRESTLASEITKNVLGDNRRLSSRGDRTLLVGEDYALVQTDEVVDNNLHVTTSGFTLVEDNKRKVFINTDGINILGTNLHEYTHVFLDRLNEVNPKLYKKGLSLIEAELRKEKSDISDIINFVKTNQPNLKQESLLNEILTQTIQQKGEALINQKKNSNIKKWLKEFINWLKETLGLSQYTEEQVLNMTLEEYAEAINVDLMRGESFDKLFKTAQEYYTRNADRLPLTLAVFQRPEFVKMQGKTVNPITILNSLNQSGIKQIEKELIKNIVEETYKGQTKINYDELEATVRANIMPLERIFTSSYADYGMNNLGDGNYGEANTVILNSPIEHGVTGHFSGDFKASGRKNIKYVPKQLNDNTWVAVEEGYERQGANENNIYQYVGTAGTKEAVESWIKNYENPRQITKENTKIVVDEGWVILLNKDNQNITQIDRIDINDSQDIHQQAIDIAKERYSTVANINKGMFGHIRVWQKGDINYVAEMQSDYFQKNNARKNFLENNQKYKELVKNKEKDLEKLNAQRVISLMRINDAGYKAITNRKGTIETEIYIPLNIFGLPLGNTQGVSITKVGEYFQITQAEKQAYGMLFNTGSLATNTLEKIKNEDTTRFDSLKTVGVSVIPQDLQEDFVYLTKTYYQEQAKIEKEYNKKVENILNNLPIQEKQFIASQKEWEKRMVRETIKEASLNGATYLRFPTPYTLSVIEGYLSEGAPYEVVGAMDSDRLVVGDEIDYLGEYYTVVYSDYASITIVQSSSVMQSNIEDYLGGEIDYRTEETMNNELGFETQNAFYTIEEWQMLQLDEIFYPFNNVDLEDIATERDGGVYEIDEAKVEQIVRGYYEEEYTDIEQVLSDIGYENINVDGDIVYYTLYDTTSEVLGQPDSYADYTKADFLIEDSLDSTQQTVARKYEQIAEILKQERGEENVRIITDENGFDWYETVLREEEISKPVVAFQLTPLQIIPNISAAIEAKIQEGEIRRSCSL